MEEEEEEEEEEEGGGCEKFCDMELCLSPGGWRRSSGSSSSSSASSASAWRRGKATEEKEKQEEENGKITMFYDGRIYVGDVTDIQDGEDQRYGTTAARSCLGIELTAAMSTPALPSSSDRSLSLQRFLEKRNARSLQASSSPYRHERHPQF